MIRGPRGLLLLIVCTLPALSTQQITHTSRADDVTGLLLHQCPSAALADGLTEWQNQIASSYVRIQWSYGNVSVQCTIIINTEPWTTYCFCILYMAV